MLVANLRPVDHERTGDRRRKVCRPGTRRPGCSRVDRALGRYGHLLGRLLRRGRRQRGTHDASPCTRRQLARLDDAQERVAVLIAYRADGASDAPEGTAGVVRLCMGKIVCIQVQLRTIAEREHGDRHLVRGRLARDFVAGDGRIEPGAVREARVVGQQDRGVRHVDRTPRGAVGGAQVLGRVAAKDGVAVAPPTHAGLIAVRVERGGAAATQLQPARRRDPGHPFRVGQGALAEWYGFHKRSSSVVRPHSARRVKRREGSNLDRGGGHRPRFPCTRACAPQPGAYQTAARSMRCR